MSARRIIPDAVLQRQIEASDPAVSAWVSANAGSGKTHVLAQRVIRLLLEGAEPERILCITFTKAASANMAKRVFDTLAQWTAHDDATLDRVILATSGIAPNPKVRARARQLFALALETPGGLKVQTIHAFCTRLLHQFPFEANVAARFEVLDAASEARLLNEVSVGVLLDASARPNDALGHALATAISLASDMAFKSAISEAIRKRDLLRAWVDHAGSIDAAIAGLCGTLGITPGDTIERVDAETTEGPLLPSARWAAAADTFAQGSKNDHDRAACLRAALQASGEERADIYRRLFITGTGELRKSVVTRAIESLDPSLTSDLQAERERIAGLIERRRAVICRERTKALVTIADAVVVRYQAEKDRRGLLDYDDLIERTLALLERVDSAWVHYKLDRGVDHVLIDEAQDTSPHQWRIVRALTAEFFVGASARMLDRTIFAVGDEKQSIFSFQGAVPREFDTMRKDFAKLCQAVDQELRYVPFRHSFRSGPNVLAAVDTVFARPQAFSGLSADNVGTVHESLPEARPGVVEIWDTTRPDQKRDIEAWDAPFDNVTETSAQARLAQRIAKNVARMTKQGARAGDVLILVRQRGALFEAIIRSLKDNHVAVAGADRLVLTEHIAVMDLMVLADALLLPDDDLALATVLKSPLFGFDDDDLFEIAWKRRGSLRAALRSGAGEDFAAAARELDQLADLARRESPFAFYAHVLGRRHGRQRMRARLGPEVDDALDEFLNLALDYESREPPSLQGFVAWLRGANAEIKRDMEIARDEVRVMTVHGAKGLEAPIVILADTTTLPAGPPQRQPRLVTLPGAGTPGVPEPFVWAGAKATEAALVNTARDGVRGEAENEYRRLLYVGMTRAIDRLIVCGYDGERKRPQGCWYDLVFDALSAIAVVSEPASGTTNGTEGPIWRFGGDAPTAVGATGPAPALPPEPLRPLWLDRDAAPEVRQLVPLSPSSAYDEATTVRAGGGLEPRKALARGSATHRLLQSLPDIPPEARQEAARRHMTRVPELDAEERETVVDQALAILGDAHFAELFQPGSRAEVPIVGRLTLRDHTVAVSGQVDRLVVTADAVLIADYKTNRPAPTRIEDVPPAYVIQLALYRAVLARLYPDRVIRAALVWTDVPDLMEISADAMDHALARVTPA